MRFSLLAALLSLASIAAADGSTGPAPIYDGFDNGENLGGWSYNPGDVIESTGGAPDGWLHQPSADTFGPIFTTSAAAYSGDYRAAGVDQIAFDARLDNMTFGDGSGFEMAILLRDTKGTTSVDDDDYAYFVGPNIPIKGTGWQSYSFTIPSQDTSAVPAGWTGGWVGDGEHFRPGIDWNDVISSVDRAEIWWINPAFFAIFQQWDIGLDNIVMSADGQANVRNGSGVNPVGYASTSTPTQGATWTSTVDIATPGHVLSAVVVSIGGATEGIFPGGAVVGELLVLPNYLVDVQAGAHAFPLPSSVSVIGTCVATQAATVASDGSIHLNNAIDVVIGG